jgi:fructoselysine 6-kinase
MLVCIGDNCIDDYLAPVNQRFAGGNALNVAANLRKHDFPAAYVGCVGDDAEGRYLLHALHTLGVDISHVSVLAGRTGLTRVRVDAGEPSILEESYGVSSHVPLDTSLLDFLRARADLVHLSVNGEAEQVAAFLHGESIPLACDLSDRNPLQFADGEQALLPSLDYVFLSGAALSLSELHTLIAKIVQQGPQHVIATRGAQGSLAYWEGACVEAPALLSAHEVLDAFGAGDAFIAGFLHSVLRGGTVEQHLECASRWSAEACRHYGAW